MTQTIYGRFMDMTMLPATGYTLSWGIPELVFRKCGYQSFPQPWWALNETSSIYGRFRNVALLLLGSSSYIIWKVGYDAGNFDKVASELMWYSAMLISYWAHCPFLKHGCEKSKWAIFAVSMTTCLSIHVAIIFFKINVSAGLLVIPFALHQFHLALWNMWLYQESKFIESRPKGYGTGFHAWIETTRFYQFYEKLSKLRDNKWVKRLLQ